MSSIRRQTSSRANGALSKGPRTLEGKRRSSLNGLRHGLLARNSVCRLEDPVNFDIVVNEHAAALQPANGIQEGLVEEMASAYWRMNRLLAIETGMFNRAIDSTPAKAPTMERFVMAFSNLAGDDAYRLIDLYQGRLHRRYHRALNTFLLLRDKPDPDPTDPDPAGPAITETGLGPNSHSPATPPAELPLEPALDAPATATPETAPDQTTPAEHETPINAIAPNVPITSETSLNTGTHFTETLCEAASIEAGRPKDDLLVGNLEPQTPTLLKLQSATPSHDQINPCISR